MIVREVTFSGFRNLHPGQWQPCEGVNILYGDNAQGKTNVLEACWLFTGSRSFRGARDSELVQFGCEQAALTMAFFSGNREQTAAIRIQQRRHAQLNGVPLPSAARLAGNLCGVVFSPAHLSLIKDGPQERRRLVDSACCQLRPRYVSIAAEYQKTVTQRNAFLKQCRETGGLTDSAEELLNLWDNALAVAGARITTARRRYIEQIQPLAKAVYDGLSGGRETLALQWQTPVLASEEELPPPAEIARRWQEALRQARHADVAAGFSTAGAHREDLQILLDDVPARAYGSQGQQRSAVLALKLAEAAMLQQVTGEPPVVFLDDVMSEMDEFRQDYIFHHIRDWQVFITCCEPSAALRTTAGKAFQIKQGVIT